jgi:hypothetical protein
MLWSERQVEKRSTLWGHLFPAATLPPAESGIQADAEYLVRQAQFDEEWKVDLTATPTPVSVSENWWDDFVGARVTGQRGNWKVVGRGDVGGAGSDLVRNVSLLGDYRSKKWGSEFAGYRVLDYDNSSGSGASRFVFDTRLQGPRLGLAF